MILIVAPYSPPGSCSMPHLGAARKIELVIGTLSAIDPEIVLVNSAHNATEDRCLCISKTMIAGQSVTEIIPRTRKNRQLGKFVNLFELGETLAAVRKIGSPSIVWAYNGYAFESLMVRSLKKAFGVPTILEFEDWHFSRSRGLSLKPYIDWILWRLIVKRFDAAFVVNQELREKVDGLVTRVFPLPGMVSDEFLRVVNKRAPFSDPERVNVGYFGGLSREKGADLLLDLIRSNVPNTVFHVTGIGELTSEFRSLAESGFRGLVFHGTVPSDSLASIVADCDVILNPHSSIEKMAGGVFPFKVIEGVSTGRLVISSTLPKSGYEECLKGVCVVDGSLMEFARAISTARMTYFSNVNEIRSGADLAVGAFSCSAVREKIRLI